MALRAFHKPAVFEFLASLPACLTDLLAFLVGAALTLALLALCLDFLALYLFLLDNLAIPIFRLNCRVALIASLALSVAFLVTVRSFSLYAFSTRSR